MEDKEYEEKYAELKKKLAERKSSLSYDTGGTLLFGAISGLLLGGDIFLSRCVYDMLMRTGISDSSSFILKYFPLAISILLGINGLKPIVDPIEQFFVHLGCARDDLSNIHDTKKKIKQLKRNYTK